MTGGQHRWLRGPRGRDARRSQAAHAGAVVAADEDRHPLPRALSGGPRAGRALRQPPADAEPVQRELDLDPAPARDGHPTATDDGRRDGAPAGAARRPARRGGLPAPPGGRRAARDPHLVGPARGRPRVQGQEAAAAGVPRLRLARAPARAVPRGGAAQPPARAEVYLGVRAIVPHRRRRASSAPRTRPAPSSTPSRWPATTRRRRSRAGSRPAPLRGHGVAAVGARLAPSTPRLRSPADPERDGRGARGDARARTSRPCAACRNEPIGPLIDDAARLAAAVPAGAPRRAARRARRARARRPRGPPRRARRARARDRDRRLRRVRPGAAGASTSGSTSPSSSWTSLRRDERLAPRSSRPTATPAAIRATTRSSTSSPPSGRSSARRSRWCARARWPAPDAARRRADADVAARAGRAARLARADRAGCRVVCGTAASGKSTLAATLGGAGGARRRWPPMSSARRSLGLAPRRGRPRAAYTPEVEPPDLRRARATGPRAARRRRARRRGRHVPLRRRPRAVRCGARRRGGAHVWLECRAPEALRLERAAARMRDTERVSDADPAVAVAPGARSGSR